MQPGTIDITKKIFRKLATCDRGDELEAVRKIVDDALQGSFANGFVDGGDWAWFKKEHIDNSVAKQED